VLAALAVVGWSSSAGAGDVVRLGLTDDTPTTPAIGQKDTDDGLMSLEMRDQDTDAEPLPVWRGGGGRGGFVAGGYRGGFGGARGGFAAGGYRAGFGGYRGGVVAGGYRGGFGGYRGGVVAGGYRGGFGGYRYGFGGYRAGFVGGYRGFYPGFGRYGYGFGYGRGFYPWYGGYGYGLGYGGYYGGYWPCATLSGGVGAVVSTLSVPADMADVPVQPAMPLDEPAPPPEQVEVPQAPPAAAPGNPTFPYDGGPQNLVPMPGREPAPTTRPPVAVPQRSVPMEGRSVSLPVKLKFTYAAYGEQSSPDGFASERTVLLKGQR